MVMPNSSAITRC